MNFENYEMYESHGSGKFKIEDFKKIGENVIFERGVLVFHPENISIGNNIYVGHNTVLKGYFKNEMVVGDHTWIGQNCFLHSAGGLSIGSAVGIGPMVKILTSVHKEEELAKPILFCDLEFKEVIIEDGCDIGIGSIILPGVEIGEGSIIGAGAIVTKDIPTYSVAVGNPARVIRKRQDDGI